MAIISFLRSSSYNRFDWCEHLYYIEYVLGLKGPSNFKAEKGNILHKILELLALVKKAQQDNILLINEQGIGEIDTKKFDLEDLFKKSCDFYISKSIHSYADKDIREIRRWLDKVLNYKNGLYNPLNQKIISAEQTFEIEFPDKWATYEYELNGEKYKGQFGIKGNIDLVSEYTPNIYQLCDYKSGQRKNWGGNGQEKTFDDITKDFQVQLYYFALCHTYPTKEIIINMYYVNDGNVFTIPLERTQLPKIKERIRERFEEIKAVEMPKLLHPHRNDFRCYRLCHAYKTKVKGSSLCEHIHYELKKKGMKKVTEEYIKEGFDPQKYYEGGGKMEMK